MPIDQNLNQMKEKTRIRGQPVLDRPSLTRKVPYLTKMLSDSTTIKT